MTGSARLRDKAEALRLGHTNTRIVDTNCHDINTHVHELHVGFRTGGLVEDFYSDRDLHCFTFWDPDALKYTSNHHKCSVNKHLDDFDGLKIKNTTFLLSVWCLNRPSQELQIITWL